MKSHLAPSVIYYLIVLAIELSAGVVANGFIVGLNCIDWAKSRTLTSYDIIITSLAFSRFCLQFLVTIDNFFSMLFPNFFDIFERLHSYLVTWMFINQVSLCFATCLSVFYCLKIATLNQSLFRWLKLRISKLTPWLLLGSLLYCLVTTVCFTFFSYSYSVSFYNFTDNSTMSYNRKKAMEFTFLVHSIGSILPLIIFIASSVLLFLSLWKHIRKMNFNLDFIPSFRNPSMESHVRALKSVLSFFILYNIYYAASTFSIGYIPCFSEKWKAMFWTVLAAAYPSVHSIILILGNAKLKLSSSKILYCTNSCFRQVTS
ncbi:taste receptor type 2 member 2-like [Pelodiscus sinensis]|uniref:taste receptor type 2 member 2-like n=1 Tax=Pelodiscus sinensis TaxID=13735 RepID=UPI0003C47FC5|nr:taste receptor type 2 member 9-like [Pelodiscus sinensis]|eukprot:XP_006131037.1 taste receptor type 2 member 9-like [Pelodiscus sinensis]